VRCSPPTITEPSNWRAAQHFDAWLEIVIDCPRSSGSTPAQLTRRDPRDGGAPNGVIAHSKDGVFDIPALVAEAESRGPASTAWTSRWT
jgi:carbamoyl-phosphate synthase small subunit